MNFLPNVVMPNLPLRKPTSSLVVRAQSPSTGQALAPSPVRPAPANNLQGVFLPPITSMNSPASRSPMSPSVLKSPTQTLNFCNYCAQPGNFRCKRCKKTLYCSVVCQTEDWKAHRHMCKEAEPAKDKPMESCTPPLSGDTSGVLTNADSSSIQRVFMKDLKSKVFTGTELQVVVVEFQTPGRFFIVEQITEIHEALQVITVELQKMYGFPTASAHTPVVDEVCAVQYSCDLSWYRGVVQKLEADQAHVLYIDFGNEEMVPFERIRPLTAKLQEYGPCAIECCISGVVPAAKSWSVKCCIAARQMLEGKTLTVKVFGTLDNGSTHTVDIVLSQGITLSSFLLEHEYAVKEVIDKTPSEQDINAMVNASLENFKRRSVGKDDNSWAKVPEPLTQAVGDSFTVVVTHIQSPEKMVVQKVDNAGVIQDLQMKLREHCSQVSSSTNFRPAPGTVCCASFSEDKQWYRAKVLAYSSEERVCVGYVDFGNSEDVDLNDLRPISQSLLATPMQAMTCALAGVQPVGETWSGECLQALQGRISNRILRIEIQGSHEGNVLVTLIDEASDPQANIAELLMFAGFAAPVDNKNNSDDKPTEMTPGAPDLPVPSPDREPLVWSCAELSPGGQTVLLRVCCVENLGKFFCHILNHTDNQRLIDLEAELKPHCEVAASSFDPKLGEPCCAIITETGGKCFRALVKQLCDDEVLAVLVDYGHCMRVKKSNLRPITPKHLELPFQALPCWLAGVLPEGAEWSPESLLRFQTLVEDETLSARVLSVTEDGYGVELQSKGQSVAAALVAEHLAKFSGKEKKEETVSVSESKQNENIAEKKQEQPQGPPEQKQTPGDVAPAPVEVPTFPVNWKTEVLPVNETFQPSIAAVSKPSLFYLFGPRQVSEEQIQEMMRQLAEYCNYAVSQPPVDDSNKPVAGAACCARFTVDNNWYRAVVLEVCDQEASVVYADYGNSEKLSLSNILPIPARFLQLPFQIIRCSICDKELVPTEWPGEVLQMFLGSLQPGVLATVQSFDGFCNLLSLSLPNESGEGQVNINTVVLGALQARSQSSAGPGSDETLAKTDKTEATSPPLMPPRVEGGSATQEVPPMEAPQIPKLAENTEAALAVPVQEILKHMEPPCITDEKTRGALASSCCCQSLKNKIDQLDQLMQVQLSLIKKLIAQNK